MMDLRLSEAIYKLRFPLTVGIVFLHYNVLSEIAIGAIPLQSEFPVCVRSIIYILNYAVPSICVPCFFIISGYLFYTNIESFSSEKYKNKVISRTKSLLSPFLLWNFVALVVSLILFYTGCVVSSEPHYSFSRFVNTFLCSNNGIILYPTETASVVWPFPILGPMWYVRELFVMTLISPLIYYLIKQLKFLFLFFSGAIWTVVMILPFEWVGYSNLFGNALFFFTGGGCPKTLTR